jgi:hypothetical protein
MATAPSLEPVERIWSFPDYASSTFNGGAWGETTLEIGAEPNGIPLSLVFTLLTEEEMQLWREHYAVQQEKYSFRLPASAWAGYDINDASMLFPISAEWFYAGELEEEPVSAGLYNCTVPLISSSALT